jgi:hypothetical protein
VIRLNGNVYVIECKASFSPILTKGNYLAIEDIAPRHTYVVIPAAEGWPMNRGIDVVSLGELQEKLAGRIRSNRSK